MNSVTAWWPTLRGHPPGLFYLAAAEAWERFSFYGMQALLVLYMVDHLLPSANWRSVIGLPEMRQGLEAVYGPLSVRAFASQLFGLYTGLVAFTPLFGSWAGDGPLGRKNAVVMGGVMMGVGHLLMTVESFFLVALSLLIVGCGLLKGNISTQVGELYPEGDAHRTEAFSIFYVGINIGSFIAPLICGGLGEVYGWPLGFGSAAAGMFLGLAIYILGEKHLPKDSHHRSPEAAARSALTPGGWARVKGIIYVLILGMFFTVAFSQAANVFPLWVRESTNRHVFGLEVPVTWFQSLDGLFVVACTPFVVLYWRRQRLHVNEPSDVQKMAIGSAFGALGMLVLATASLIWTRTGTRVGTEWSIVAFGLLSLGFVFRWPTTLSLISRVAPEGVRSTMIAVAFFSGFLAHFLVGWLGTLYEAMSPAAFWGLHAAISGVGACLILLFTGSLRRLLEPHG